MRGARGYSRLCALAPVARVGHAAVALHCQEGCVDCHLRRAVHVASPESATARTARRSAPRNMLLLMDRAGSFVVDMRCVLGRCKNHWSRPEAFMRSSQRRRMLLRAMAAPSWRQAFYVGVSHASSGCLQFFHHALHAFVQRLDRTNRKIHRHVHQRRRDGARAFASLRRGTRHRTARRLRQCRLQAKPGMRESIETSGTACHFQVADVAQTRGRAPGEVAALDGT